MRLAAALCIVAFPAMAAMQPVREVASQVPFGGLVPGFYNGYVFLVDQTPHNHLTLYAPDGRYVFYRYVQPDFGPSVLSVAVDSNGTVAAGWNDSAVGRAGIDLMDAGGKLLGSFDTGVYLPNSIAFAADHSIWSFGWQRVSGTSGRPAPNYMAVRHYSAEGQQLGAYLPRSLFSEGHGAGVLELAGAGDLCEQRPHRAAGLLGAKHDQPGVGGVGSEREADWTMACRFLQSAGGADHGRARLRAGDGGGTTIGAGVPAGPSFRNVSARGFEGQRKALRGGRKPTSVFAVQRAAHAPRLVQPALNPAAYQSIACEPP